MTGYGVTSTGFVVKPFADILSDKLDLARSVFGPDVDLRSTSARRKILDITSAEGDSVAVWHWIDAHGGKFGLRRPMPGADPAHIQPRNAFHDLAHQLREARIKLANTLSGIETEPAAGKTTLSDGRRGAAGDRREWQRLSRPPDFIVGRHQMPRCRLTEG